MAVKPCDRETCERALDDYQKRRALETKPRPGPALVCWETQDGAEPIRKAFKDVSAFVVTKDDNRIATIAFKFPRDGAGRLFCYLHIFGAQMVRAYASGGGYDKRTAAMHSALSRVKVDPNDITTQQTAAAFRDAVTDNGHSWDQDLYRAGFHVHQAV